jgi:phage repressor protein C with HTH and peptisase S24 domain
MNILSSNMKLKMKALGFTQGELAEKANVSQVTIHKLLTGKIANTSRIADIANALNTTVNELVGNLDRPKPTSNAEVIGPIDAWDSNTPLNDDEVEIPFYTEVQLAAGNGTLASIENIGPKLRFARSALIRNGTDVASAVCVKVSGNSMEPVIPDGSTIGIDTAKTDIVDGKIYAISHGEMQRVKMLYRLPNGGVRLKSFNSDEHPEEVYTKEEAFEIKVIGKVFWYSVLL